MRKIVKITVIALFTLLFLAWLILTFIIVPRVDAKTNKITPHAPYTISAEAKAFHDTLRVADLHADTMLWDRNAAKRNSYGHVDLPRLREGGVALQIFPTVTAVPAGMNVGSNSIEKDQIKQLAIAQMWPVRTWNSIFERGQYQAKKLQALADKDENFVFVRTKTELTKGLELRSDNPQLVIGILAAEGAQTLEGKLGNLDKMYDVGFRMIGLQHFYDNELGGSLHGINKGGLTPFGRTVVKRLNEKHMMIDLAHSSRQVVRDVLDMTDVPVVVSHTGILSKCNNPGRNLPDDLMHRITKRGGLLGIGYWEMAVCDTTPRGIAEMLKHGVDTFGVDHIALGSDFDGSIEPRFDTSELAVLTQSLMEIGMSEDHIRKIMGENLIAYVHRGLPD